MSSATSEPKSKLKSKPLPEYDDDEERSQQQQYELTASQTHALKQLRELTNGADDEVSMSVLKAVEWDVQRAAELIFESHPSTSSVPQSTRPTVQSYSPSYPSSTSSSASLSSLGSGFGRGFVNGDSNNRPPMETFEMEESQVHRGGGGGQPYRFGLPFYFPRPLLTILSFPFHILTTLVKFVFGVLRIPLPRIPGRLGFVGFGGGGGARGRGRVNADRRDGRTGIGEGWLRELEEDTGGVRIGTSSGVEVVGTSEGAMRSRKGGEVVEWGQGKKYLPQFEDCGYEDFLKKCAREKKVGCVILVSEEHDDVLGFKKEVLVDEGLVRKLYEAGVICWGGDVRDRDAWSAKERLQATTYPFVAFIALQSHRGPNVLTVLSRHQGKSATTAPMLKAHLETQVLPRVMPYLSGLLAEEKGRERDRQLRAEQDRAYDESRRRDREKWEREQQERRRKEREEREKAEAEKRKEELRRRVWRMAEGTRGKGEGGEVTVVIRLPGERVVERFGKDDELSVLYGIVDRLLAGEKNTELTTAAAVDDSHGLDTLIGQNGGKDFWSFHIVCAYPRKLIEWNAGTTLGNLDLLKGGAQVVIEMNTPIDNKDDDDDDDEDV